MLTSACVCIAHGQNDPAYHMAGHAESSSHGIMQLSGTLFVSNFRLLFITCDESGDFLCDVQHESVPLLTVSSVRSYAAGELASNPKKSAHSARETAGARTILQIRTKQLRSLRYAFLSDTDSLCSCILNLIECVIANPQQYSLALYAKPERAVSWEEWSYDARKEYARMGVDVSGGTSSSGWRLSAVNRSYNLCTSYPAWLAVPASVDDATLSDASQFRSRGRIPVLSWRCAVTGVCLARAAQPKSGTTKRRSRADEELLVAIFEAGACSTSASIQ